MTKLLSQAKNHSLSPSSLDKDTYYVALGLPVPDDPKNAQFLIQSPQDKNPWASLSTEEIWIGTLPAIWQNVVC